MSFLSAMNKMSAPALGTAPAHRAPVVGSPPPVQAHIEPPPYDAALDPGWKNVLDPNDHELRNFLNGLSPEERQMLLVRVGKMNSPQPAIGSPVAPVSSSPQGA